MRILVTGGLGFIGSHTVVELLKTGHDVHIVDNCTNSNTEALLRIKDITGKVPGYDYVDIRDLPALRYIAKNLNKIDAIIHFAALKSVSESMNEPYKYYTNNVTGTLNVLAILKECNVSTLIFSSSATVYGEPETLPITEQEPIKPASSVYGTTKQVCERMIQDYQREYQFTGWLLRYFNPVGAHPTGLLGEAPSGVPNNLFPYITQTAVGIREQLTVYGKDYETSDGTCMRDFIHVVDLAKAHVATLTSPVKSKTKIVNVGTGRGHTVQEVIDAFQHVNKLKLNYKYAERRPGDVPITYCDAAHAQEVLGWCTEMTLTDMVRDAWNYQQRLS